ncbi:O-antigen polysaccharide polymerase Wzy [Corynebacterium sp. H127]|uniref:O-antigen polysaccharide polymerase Wzy n=1 Tax=Corynebacterium sp. H127 TaxID=3133418 RepID=UPI0030A77501
MIPEATLGFALALGGLWVADRLYLILKGLSKNSSEAPERFELSWSSWTYNVFLIIGGLYGLLFAAIVVLRGGAGNKLAAIGDAGSFHYQYLLLMSLCLCWTVVYWRNSSKSRLLVVFAWFSFGAYGMVTAERDFILILFAIGIHLVVRNRSRKFVFEFIAMGLISAIVGTLIFVTRAGEKLSFDALLNQGSTLFIDTYIYDWIASGSWYPRNSWWSALTRQLPTPEGSLADWFVVLFTGSSYSKSGYGFSVTAEAFMIAGYFGIFFFFFLFGMCHLWLLSKAERSGLWLGISVAFLYILMYSIRGELYSMISACMTICVIALIFRMGQARTTELKSPV